MHQTVRWPQRREFGRHRGVEHGGEGDQRWGDSMDGHVGAPVGPGVMAGAPLPIGPRSRLFTGLRDLLNAAELTIITDEMAEREVSREQSVTP